MRDLVQIAITETDITPQNVKTHIDNNEPLVMITYFNVKDDRNRDISLHYMVVYGYREKVGSKLELLVHTGWYGEPDVSSSNDEVNEMWIPFKYYFGFWSFSCKLPNEVLDLTTKPKIISAKGTAPTQTILEWKAVPNAE